MARVVTIERVTVIGTPGSVPQRIEDLLGDGSAIVNIEEMTVITADDARLVEAIRQALAAAPPTI